MHADGRATRVERRTGEGDRGHTMPRSMHGEGPAADLLHHHARVIAADACLPAFLNVVEGRVTNRSLAATHDRSTDMVSWPSSDSPPIRIRGQQADKL